MLKILILLSSLIIFINCGGRNIMNMGDLEANLEKTDKIYGRCNNPYRQFTKQERIICEDKARAAGADGKIDDEFNLSELIDRFNNPEKNMVYASTAINPHLWNASLSALSRYPLKTVDSQGGFISTEWIFNESTPNQRCMIKVNVNSLELISTGVNTNIVCEKKSDEQWYISDENFIEEEKRITLKILEVAQELSITQTS